MSLIRLTINAALGALLLASSASAASKSRFDEEMARLAAAASPMKAGDLKELYAGRTWKWKSGGGYFSAEKATNALLPANWNQFSAWSRQGTIWAYAEGSWYADNNGKLCLHSRWTTKKGGDIAVTCFLHREKGGVVYQKPAIGGKWYVFRHNPVQQDDEVLKLVEGDQVSGELGRIKATRR